MVPYLTKRQRLLLLTGCLLVPVARFLSNKVERLYVLWTNSIGLERTIEMAFSSWISLPRRGGLRRETARRLSILTGLTIELPGPYDANFRIEDIDADPEDLQDYIEMQERFEQLGILPDWWIRR